MAIEPDKKQIEDAIKGGPIPTLRAAATPASKEEVPTPLKKKEDTGIRPKSLEYTIEEFLAEINLRKELDAKQQADFKKFFDSLYNAHSPAKFFKTEKLSGNKGHDIADLVYALYKNTTSFSDNKFSSANGVIEIKNNQIQFIAASDTRSKTGKKDMTFADAIAMMAHAFIDPSMKEGIIIEHANKRERQLLFAAAAYLKETNLGHTPPKINNKVLMPLSYYLKLDGFDSEYKSFMDKSVPVIAEETLSGNHADENSAPAPSVMQPNAMEIGPGPAKSSTEAGMMDTKETENFTAGLEAVVPGDHDQNPGIELDGTIVASTEIPPESMPVREESTRASQNKQDFMVAENETLAGIMGVKSEVEEQLAKDENFDKSPVEDWTSEERPRPIHIVKLNGHDDVIMAIRGDDGKPQIILWDDNNGTVWMHESIYGKSNAAHPLHPEYIIRNIKLSGRFEQNNYELPDHSEHGYSYGQPQRELEHRVERLQNAFENIAKRRLAKAIEIADDIKDLKAGIAIMDEYVHAAKGNLNGHFKNAKDHNPNEEIAYELSGDVKLMGNLVNDLKKLEEKYGAPAAPTL